MKIRSIFDKEFVQYGKVVTGYDFEEVLKAVESTPDVDEMMYEPSVSELENLSICKELSDHEYGGMPIEIGYCGGCNTKLNCLEYHRDSEFIIPLNDIIMLAGTRKDIVDGKYDTSKLQAFRIPAGTAHEVYATTLHYAPFTEDNKAFKQIVVLPLGTNFDKPSIVAKNLEDQMLFGRNKWVLAHAEANEAKDGAYVGLIGKNLDYSDVF